MLPIEIQSINVLAICCFWFAIAIRYFKVMSLGSFSKISFSYLCLNEKATWRKRFRKSNFQNNTEPQTVREVFELSKVLKTQLDMEVTLRFCCKWNKCLRPSTLVSSTLDSLHGGEVGGGKHEEHQERDPLSLHAGWWVMRSKRSLHISIMYNIKFQFNSVYEAIKWIFCLIDPDLNGKRVKMFVNKVEVSKSLSQTNNEITTVALIVRNQRRWLQRLRQGQILSCSEAKEGFHSPP